MPPPNFDSVTLTVVNTSLVSGDADHLNPFSEQSTDITG